jgi:hypothetical protein
MGSKHPTLSSAGDPSFQSRQGRESHSDVPSSPVLWVVKAGKEKDARQPQKDLERSWQRVLNLRARTRRTRQALQRMRLDLRELRQTTAQSELLFISGFNEAIDPAIETTSSTAAGISDSIQDLWGKMRSKELEYDDLEDTMADAEFSLEKEYDRFHDCMKKVSGLHQDQNTTDDAKTIISESSGRENHTTSGAPSTKGFNPLHDYMTKIGEARILRERLDELTLEREYILSQEKLHTAHGKKLDADDLLFLEDFEDSHGHTCQELASIEREVLELERSAIDSGFLHPSGAYSTMHPLTCLPRPPGTVNMDRQEDIFTTDVGNTNPGPWPPGQVVPTRVRISSADQVPSQHKQARLIKWLQNLPPAPATEFARTAGKVSRKMDSWIIPIQPRVAWLLENIGRTAPVDPSLYSAEDSGRFEYEQFQHMHADVVSSFSV